KREAEAIDTFLQLRTDGIILVGTVVDDETVERVAAETPLVLVSAETKSDKVDTVVTDDIAGAGLAVDHLVELGHRRIAHITGGTGAGAADRVRGFREAMERHGLAAEARIADGDYTEAGGIAGVDELFSSDPRP